MLLRFSNPTGGRHSSMMMYEHPNIWKSYPFSQILGDKVVKIAKSLLGVLWQDKFGVKKSSKKNGFVLENALFVTTPPSTKKNGFKVWNNEILVFFTVFTKGTQEIFIELESESNIFMQKLKIIIDTSPLQLLHSALMTVMLELKMTGETPEVRSDKRKPREDRQNQRYHRVIMDPW